MENAFIKLVPASIKQEITLEDVKELFLYYKEITSKTGNQLDWDYEENAFPYTISEKEKGFILRSKDQRYHSILIGVGNEKGGDDEQYYIQIGLPSVSTFGDKGKAIEFSKFLAKKLEGELHLFNGRIMYYYKRK